MERAAGGGAPEDVLAASDMYPASNRKRAFGEHQGAALPDLLQITWNGLRYSPSVHAYYGD